MFMAAPGVIGSSRSLDKTGGPGWGFGGYGLDRHGAEAVLNRNDGLEAIKEADALARRFGGVDGVPFFIVNGTLTLSGAQQPGAFLDAFRQALTAG